MSKKCSPSIKITIINENKKAARRIYSRQSKNSSTECIIKLKNPIKAPRDKIVNKISESRKILHISIPQRP